MGISGSAGQAGLRFRIRLPQLLIISIWSLALGLLWANFRSPTTEAVKAGDYDDWRVLRGWYAPEPLPFIGRVGRWSAGRATLAFARRGVGIAALRLDLFAPDQSTIPKHVELTQRGRTIESFGVSARPRTYHMLVALPTDGGDLTLSIVSSAQVVAGGQRVIGVGIGSAALNGPLGGWPPLVPLLAALGGALLFGLLAAALWP